MTDVGISTWNKGEKFGFNKGEKSGVKKEKINSAINHVKSLMDHNYTLEEAISLLNVDEKTAKVVRKRLNK